MSNNFKLDFPLIIATENRSTGISWSVLGSFVTCHKSWLRVNNLSLEFDEKEKFNFSQKLLQVNATEASSSPIRPQVRTSTPRVSVATEASPNPIREPMSNHIESWRSRNRTTCMTWRCVLSNFNTGASELELLREVVNPFSTWFLCDVFIGTEVQSYLGKEMFEEFQRQTGVRRAFDCSQLPEKTTLFVQSNYFFKDFLQKCLPVLQSRIFLITGQWQKPALHHTAKTMQVLNHPFILHWFAQNPFITHHKMTAIPYGAIQKNLQVLINVAAQEPWNKTRVIANLKLSPTHPERKFFINKNAVAQKPADYYTLIRESEYVISPQGDRPDCFRHWEAIALGTVPICNCPLEYKQLFEDNMIFSNVAEMQYMIENPRSLQRGKHRYLNYDILAVGYWVERIEQTKLKFAM